MFQMKIVCGTLESLGHAVATLLQLMSLYKGEQEIHIPTLLVSIESVPPPQPYTVDRTLKSKN